MRTAPTETQSNAPIAHRDVRWSSVAGRSPGSRAHVSHAGESPSHVHDAVAFRFAVACLPLRGQRRVWFSQATETRTGFPFHSPPLSVQPNNAG